MKVILMQDVAKIGRKHDVVEVSDGYGMNKLLPRGFAKPATPENLKAIERQKERQSSENEASHTAFTALCEALKDTTVSVTAEANDEGKLFQALKPAEVAAAIAAATKQDVSEQHVVVEAPIKTVGDHVIIIASGADSTKQTITVAAA